MLYAFDFHYAGLTIDAAQDTEGNIWISTPTIENILSIRADSTREIVSSKSFKAFAGDGFQLGKTKQKSTKHNSANLYYSKESFLKILYFELQNDPISLLHSNFSGFTTLLDAHHRLT